MFPLRFSNTTVRIAERAKVGKKHLYHFPTKEDVLIHLLDDGLTHMGQYMEGKYGR